MMWQIIIMLILYTIECLPSLPKLLRYRNVNAIGVAFWFFVISFLVDILIAFSATVSYGNKELFGFLAIQTAVLVFVKIISARKDSIVKYGIPIKYTSGWRQQVISAFYDTEEKGATVYTKDATNQIGVVAFLCVSILLWAIISQTIGYSAVGNPLIMPFSIAALFAFIVEFSIFCYGESRWRTLVSQYKNRRNCKNRRELAKARFASLTDFSYIFMKNFVWEPLHIMRATKFNWKQDVFPSIIKYRDFTNRSEEEYSKKEYNPELEEFIKSNDLEVNDAYIAAYNFIERNQNVLIKTPSYVEFEPYFTAMIKMKIAKTQKVVLIVSNEEKKKLTLEKINAAFNDYMGFDEIPYMLTIDECVKNCNKAREEKEEKERTRLSHFDVLTKKGKVDFETDGIKPVKSADIIIAAPEDIFNCQYTEFLRTIISNLGLIVYYDFSDSVQEEALFAKIVHSVLDYDDRVSTLYMSDGFFDLEQVVDNFFSKRNVYEIIVPRKPSKQSYVMGWKAENISEMQSRTYSDASRDIGPHIPILYDSGAHTRNDLMIVEDELDVYAENQSNFADEELSKRLDTHVGWTDVIGGNSVMCTVSDTYNNVAHAYLAMRGVGSESEYINIISRPYLLRNYLAYHLRYFTIYPGVLSSYSPGLIKTSKALSYEAIVKLYVVGCTEEQLKNYIGIASISCEMTPEAMIRALVKCAGYEEGEKVEITKNLRARYFIDVKTYTAVIEESKLVEKIEFVTNRHVYVRNKRDFEYLIPHQKLVLDGIKYTVEKIQGNRVELTDSNTREPVAVMRPVRSLTTKVKDVEEYGSYIQNNSDSSLAFRRIIADAEITTYGNIVFKGSYHPFRDDARYDYQTVAEVKSKQYSDVNIFNINIGSRYINSENRGRLGHLLALLLNEMLPTFFPRHSNRIIVACNDWKINSDLENQKATTQHIVAQMDIDGDISSNDNEISLYILEDSPIETGLVNVFWQDEEFRYMLKVLEDYLYFQKMINRNEQREIFADKYIKDLNLLRRILIEVINETHEIENDRKEIDVYFHNSIKSSRNKFNNLEIMKWFDVSCDFCGKKVVGRNANEIDYHYYANSGLVSCMDCYRTAVCGKKHSQADIRKLEKIVNDWFKKRYDDTAPDGYYNYLEDEERIQEASSIKDRIVVTDDYDHGVIRGLASSGAIGKTIDVPLGKELIEISPNEENIAKTQEVLHSNEGFVDFVRASYLVEDISYPYILIKDGMPYSEYMGVLTHEMTHQWQFANLDFDLLEIAPPNNYVNEFGLVEDMTGFRVEGMAEWERIQYIKNHGGRRYARKEDRILRATRNAYGYGYIWMCNFMKVGHDDMSIPVHRTFSFIMKRNYYQLTKNSFALMRLYFGKEAAPETTVDGETA